MSHSPTDVSSAPPVASGPRPASKNPLRSLLEFGQSLWLDDLRRSLFTSGEFNRLIAEDGLRGVTHVRELQGLDTPLLAGDVLFVLPAVSGG